MAEARRNIYGQLFQIREQEYTQEVSKAPADTYVIVHLSANTYEQTQTDTQSAERGSWRGRCRCCNAQCYVLTFSL